MNEARQSQLRILRRMTLAFVGGLFLTFLADLSMAPYLVALRGC